MTPTIWKKCPLRIIVLRQRTTKIKFQDPNEEAVVTPQDNSLITIFRKSDISRYSSRIIMESTTPVQERKIPRFNNTKTDPENKQHIHE